jgi:hypothetical protein
LECWSLEKASLFPSREGVQVFKMLESRKDTIPFPSREGVEAFGMLEFRKDITIPSRGSSGAGEDVIISLQVKRAGFWNPEVRRVHHHLPAGGRNGWP